MKYIFHTKLKDVAAAARAIELHEKNYPDVELSGVEFTFASGNKENFSTKKNKNSYSVWGPT
jgi:hypothetical protein